MTKTKKQIATLAVSWALVAACMIIIFSLSAQNGVDSQMLSDDFTFFLGLPLSVVNFIRKAAHFLEFTGLAVLIYNALYRTFGFTRPYLSFILTAVYAVSDEIHQIFVPERACRLFDIFVDCCGAVTGIAVLSIIIFICKKYKSRRGLI